MPVLPKSLILLSARLGAARASRRLARRGRDASRQQRTFRHLTASLAKTAYGRAVGMEAGISYSTFRTRLPIQQYETIVPYLDRIKRGESDVLCPGPCTEFSLTAGTSTGRPRAIPVPPVMQEHFMRAVRQAIYFYGARSRRLDVLNGRHLLLSGAVNPGLSGIPSASGDSCAMVARCLPLWAREYFYEPGSAIDRIADWSQKLDAIVERTWNRDISLLVGQPEWALALVDQLRSRVDAGSLGLRDLRSLWPKLECYIHCGSPLEPFAGRLRKCIGPGVRFHELYGAAEGVIAAQDADGSQGLRLLVDAGLFFEFVPSTEYNELRPSLSGTKAVPLEEVRSGVDYVVLLTTPGGLVRYELGDLVRFTSTSPARLVWVGRNRLVLNAAGCRLPERDVTDALVSVCEGHRWQIVNFHVAPLVAAGDLSGQRRARHEWWVELRAGTLETPTGPLLAAELDEDLRRRNANYADRRRSGLLDMPVVRLVIPGVFEYWRRMNGQWGGAHKMPRSANDRRIADSLAMLTRFNDETLSPWQ